MTSADPLVTVGLPVHDGERFLAQAIEAVLAQDVGDLELVISDNASTDATEAIGRRYAAADERVRYQRSPVNCGAAWNYNTVVDAARGRYFKWATHDDLIAPSYLSRCIEVLERRPEVVLCYARVADIDEHGRQLRVRPPVRHVVGSSVVQRTRRLLLDPTACFEILGVTRTAELRTTRLIGPYTSSDRTLLLELALLGEFHEVDAVLAFHREHQATSTNRYHGRARNAWFDPHRRGRVSFPVWRLLGEYARAVRAAPLSPGDRFGSALQLPAWAAANWRRLAKDAARGARVAVPPANGAP